MILAKIQRKATRGLGLGSGSSPRHCCHKMHVANSTKYNCIFTARHNVRTVRVRKNWKGTYDRALVPRV